MIMKFSDGKNHLLISMDNVLAIKPAAHGMGNPIDPAKGPTTFLMVGGKEITVVESFDDIVKRLGC